MKRKFKLVIGAFMLLLMNTVFISGAEAKENYPKMDEISWSFRDAVVYEEPEAVFDYTNNSEFTITRLELYFRMKDGVTSEELQLVDAISGELVPDEEIPEMEPYVLDWIVCDPGETAENASGYMTYNTEPTSTKQCELMELNYAEIYFIGEDNKQHGVFYSAENGTYEVSDKTEELFVWSDSTLAKMVPKPESRIAYVKSDDEDVFYAKVYDVAREDFLKYVTECETLGYTNKYPEEEIDYNHRGVNAEGYEIYIRYIESMHCMEIELEKETE